MTKLLNSNFQMTKSSLYKIMVIQGNPLVSKQTGIQTLSTQNFRQIFQLLYSKKNNPKSEKIYVYMVRRATTDWEWKGQLALLDAPCPSVAKPFYSLWLTSMALWHTPAYLKVPNCSLNITWTVFNVTNMNRRPNKLN